jgi:Ca-activated chloride channel family protein
MDGFFQASALFAGNANKKSSPKQVILMLDTSLSMYGDKLSRAVESADFFLHNLAPDDEFNLILFNSDTAVFAPKPVSANTEQIENALQFVKNHYISGGTNLKKAFETAVEQSKNFSAGERQIVLISDANPTLETTDINKIEKVFDKENVRLFAFALGANANENLLKSLTEKMRGFYDSARETEDIAVKLKIFFDKIGAPEISNLQFERDENFYDVYATDANSFFGSRFSIVGRYKSAKTQNFLLTGNFGAEGLKFEKMVDLPELDETHSFLPRVWARA